LGSGGPTRYVGIVSGSSQILTGEASSQPVVKKMIATEHTTALRHRNIHDLLKTSEFIISKAARGPWPADAAGV